MWHIYYIRDAMNKKVLAIVHAHYSANNTECIQLNTFKHETHLNCQCFGNMH